MKQNEILEYNAEALRSNSVRKEDSIKGSSKTKVWSF